MSERKAQYTIKIDGTTEQAEKILNEIDQYFIKLEHKYPTLHVET